MYCPHEDVSNERSMSSPARQQLSDPNPTLLHRLGRPWDTSSHLLHVYSPHPKPGFLEMPPPSYVCVPCRLEKTPVRSIRSVKISSTCSVRGVLST